MPRCISRGIRSELPESTEKKDKKIVSNENQKPPPSCPPPLLSVSLSFSLCPCLLPWTRKKERVGELKLIQTSTRRHVFEVWMCVCMCACVSILPLSLTPPPTSSPHPSFSVVFCLLLFYERRREILEASQFNFSVTDLMRSAPSKGQLVYCQSWNLWFPTSALQDINESSSKPRISLNWSEIDYLFFYLIFSTYNLIIILQFPLLFPQPTHTHTHTRASTCC